ncbi:hypothetical protein D050_3969 [Vibrio parahaemolyticus VPCR-2009]|nr:hypothetical protein D050_3969 [Vibrio parahaemolyticus VPCR-2009]
MSAVFLCSISARDQAYKNKKAETMLHLLAHIQFWLLNAA